MKLADGVLDTWPVTVVPSVLNPVITGKFCKPLGPTSASPWSLRTNPEPDVVASNARSGSPAGRSMPAVAPVPLPVSTFFRIVTS